MTTNCCTELYLRPLPYLDAKWLRADLIASLRNAEDTAVLWNNLIQDCELVSSPAAPVLNGAGNWSYMGEYGKHYCGVEKLQCLCCSIGYCGPLSACNCTSCRALDSDAAIKKMTSAAAQSAAHNARTPSDGFFESWLWGKSPSHDAKLSCMRSLLTELHDIALQAAANCLSSVHLRQQLFIYERYLVALTRCKQLQHQRQQQYQQQQQQQQHQHQLISSAASIASDCRDNQTRERNIFAAGKFRHHHQQQQLDIPSPIKENERATLGLARVGTRAALNFSFAFLRRAWRSGEDTEMCSELLCEALESLQDLPEASLFDTTQVSPLLSMVLQINLDFNLFRHTSFSFDRQNSTQRQLRMAIFTLPADRYYKF